MAMIAFTTFALAGCAFLVYACFHWLREELDLKRPAHRDRGRKMPPPACLTTKRKKKQIHRAQGARWNRVRRFARN